MYIGKQHIYIYTHISFYICTYTSLSLSLSIYVYIYIYIYVYPGSQSSLGSDSLRVSSVKLGTITEKISMAPAPGRHAQIEKRKQFCGRTPI